MSDAAARAHPLPPTEVAPSPLGEAPTLLEPSPVQGLGRAAAMGFMLMSGQSILTRVLAFGTTIVMTRIFSPEQFGLFNLSMAIVNYANLAQQVGVREILVSRQKRLELWSNPGFWVSTATGVLSMLLIVGAAPVAGWIYQDTTLVWMLLILALAQPTYNMTLVQEAKLQKHLRFRYMAACQFVWGALSPLLQLVFALVHLGVYAFVLPRLIAGLVRWWMVARAEPITVRTDPQFRRWKYILGPGMMFLLTGLAYTMGPSVPILMLGRFVGKDDAGYFGLAYNLSMQTLMLLSMQIDSVLFPTLGKMAGDPARQRAALLRAARALTAVMAPVCLLQIAAARPLVLLVYKDAWEPTVIALQILSVGMLSTGGFAPAQSLLQAQGRFKAKLFIALVWAAVSAAASVAGILCAPREHAVAAAAAALSLGYFGYGFHNCVAATRPMGGGFSDALRVIVMPSVVGGLATGLAWWAASFVPAFPAHPWLGLVLQLACIGSVGMTAYAILLRVLAPALWADLMLAGAPVIGRLRRFLPGRGGEIAP